MGAGTPPVSSAENGSPDPRTGDRTHRLIIGVLALLCVAALVAALLLWREVRSLQDTADLDRAESQAARAAGRIAVDMTSYDHATLDVDFDWVRRDGTDSFEATYSESTEPIRELIARTRANAEGRVSDSAATADDEDHVTVLLFVDQVLRRAGDKQGSVDSNRVVMSMVRQDGRWLVDDVALR